MSTNGIQLRILGPLEVRVGGSAQELRRPKSRAVLLVLALHANRFVGAGHLADALWDGDPPASAPANLRNYLTEIGRLLIRPVHADEPPLVRRAGGALLRLEASQLDLLRFHDELRAARERANQGDLAAAGGHYRAGLELWRGGVAEGLSCGPTLGHELDLVECLLLDAVEEFAEVRLRLGEHAGLAEELRKVVAGHPYRERAWAGMMLALYRSGQAAGALDAYREAERVLRTDLGVE